MRRWLAFGALALLATAVLVLRTGPRIQVDTLRPRLESALGAFLGQSVQLPGPVELELSWRPGLYLSEVRVENPPGWSGPPLAEVASLGGHVALIPLLSRRLQFEELHAEGIRLSPRTNSAGSRNWKLPAQEQPAQGGERSTAVAIRQLTLKDLELTIPPGRHDAPRALRVDHLEASSLTPSGVSALAHGRWHDAPWRATLTGDQVDRLLAGEPWNYQLEAELADNHAALQGQLQPASKRLETEVALVSPRLEAFGALVGLRLPPVGETHARCNLYYDGGTLAISELAASLGESQIEGSLQLHLEPTPPLVRGTSRAPVLDLGTWFDRAAGPQVAKAQLTDREVPPVMPWGLDLDIGVGELKGTPVRANQLVANLKHRGGTWQAAGRITLANTLTELDLRGHSSVGGTRWRGQLHMGPTDVADLAPLLGLSTVLGRFNRLHATVHATGTDSDRLLSSLEFDASLEDAALRYGEEGVPLSLQRAALSRSPQAPMTLTASGSLLRTPFTLVIEAEDPLRARPGAALAIEASLEGAGATLMAHGTTSRQDLDLQLKLAGARLGDLAPWLGVSPEAAMAYALDGALRYDSDGWTIAAESWRVGGSTGRGSVGRRSAEDGPWQIALEADALDPLELPTVTPKRESSAQNRWDLDLPILPHSLSLKDADLDLRIRQLLLPGRDLKGLSLSGQVRDGHLPGSAIKITVGGQLLTGDLLVDLRERMPLVIARIGGQDIDQGALYQGAGGGAGLDWQARNFGLDLRLQGNTLAEVLSQASLQAEITDGIWRWGNPADDQERILTLGRSELVAAPEQRTALSLEGDVDGFPLSLLLSTDPLVRLARPAKRGTVPVTVSGRSPGVDLDMEGELPRPGSDQPTAMNLALQADNLNRLDQLFGVDLPPLGAFSLEGKLALDDQRATLLDLRAALGNTDLSGTLTLTRGRMRPNLSATLRSRHLDVSDFVVGNWSTLRGGEQADIKPSAAAVTTSLDMATDAGKRIVEQLPPLLSRAALKALEATLVLEADAITLGAEPLGSGVVRAQVDNGRLSIDPLDLDLDTGFARASMEFVPTLNGTTLELALDVDDFDYGVPARWVQPDTGVAGLVSLGMEISTHFEPGKPLLGQANGRVDFNARPQGIQAAVFDFWATNLLFALLPSMDTEGGSVINCINGQFNLREGVMKQELLLLDTSKVRVVGEAEVDFQNQTVDLRLVPRAKRPQFLSVATPVRARGKFSDFKLGVTPAALAQSIVRLTYYWVDVPLQWLLQGTLPEDGSDVCDVLPRRPDGGGSVLEIGERMGR